MGALAATASRTSATVTLTPEVTSEGAKCPGVLAGFRSCLRTCIARKRNEVSSRANAARV